MIDYPTHTLAMAAPWIFKFAGKNAATGIVLALGATAIINALTTNFEAGAVKKVPMKTHLNMDLVAGLFLAASPWLFGFSKKVFLPHLIFGLAEAGLALMTKTKQEPGAEHLMAAA